MMRFSASKRNEVVDVHATKGAAATRVRGHKRLFDAVAEATKADDRVGGLLFVGGNGPRDVAVRWAQAPLRMDRTPSHWSHVAIVLRWPDGARPRDVVGVEVSLEPQHPEFQVPEWNGVTLFQLSRYLDRPDRYPNLGFAALDLTPRKADRGGGAAGRPESPLSAPEARAAIVRAALSPVADRVRYPYWEWLGAWAGYVCTGRDNPLLAHVSHPSAALCESVYEAARVHLTPGASAPDTCPDTLWSTLLYWYDRIAVSRVRVWTSIAPDDGLVRQGGLKTLPEAFEELTAAGGEAS